MAINIRSQRLKIIRDRILAAMGPDKQVILECSCYVIIQMDRAPRGVIPVVAVGDDCLLMVYRQPNEVLFRWLRQQMINYLVWCPMRHPVLGAANGYSAEEIRNWAPNEVGVVQAQED